MVRLKEPRADSTTKPGKIRAQLIDIEHRLSFLRVLRDALQCALIAADGGREVSNYSRQDKLMERLSLERHIFTLLQIASPGGLSTLSLYQTCSVLFPALKLATFRAHLNQLSTRLLITRSGDYWQLPEHLP